MKTIFLHITLCILGSYSTFSQELIWDQNKDRKVRKMDEVAKGIDQDKTLVRYKVNKDWINAEIDSTSLAIAFHFDLQQNLESKATPTFFYLKDSTVVKIIYEGQAYYFLDEKLILFNRKYDGVSDMDKQCCPSSIDNYHYYWKNAYYKSFEGLTPICNNPCTGVITSTGDNKRIQALLKKIKTIPIKE